MAVNWSVNGVAGGNSTVGMISASGVYTAPVTVPTPATVTITAVSVADSTKMGSAQITVMPATAAASGWWLVDQQHWRRQLHQQRRWRRRSHGPTELLACALVVGFVAKRRQRRL